MQLSVLNLAVGFGRERTFVDVLLGVEIRLDAGGVSRMRVRLRLTPTIPRLPRAREEWRAHEGGGPRIHARSLV